MAKAKEKLTPIPKPGKGKRDATRKVASATPDAATPDLSHIAEGLRALAMPTADLAFMVGNPLTHPDEQIEELKASLQQFGQVEALIVNRRPTPPVVIGGNGRLQAMLALNWTHAAVVTVNLDEAKANALAIVLNRSREGAKWNKEAFHKLLEDIDTGNDERLDQMMSELAEELKIIPKDEGDKGSATVQAKIKCPECGHEFEAP